MILKEKKLVRLVKIMLYSSGKDMKTMADELGVSEETLHRRGHRGRMIFSWGEIGAIAKSCGYKIYIEKPDVRIDITDLIDEEEDDTEC